MSQERRQFRVLYRHFLSGALDLDLFSPTGNASTLLGQVAAVLAALSLAFAAVVVTPFASARLSAEQLKAVVWSSEEFQIATTIAVVGLFTLLAWNSMMPNLRDCLVLGLLPIRDRTILLAKMAAVATTIGIATLSLNLFTGLCYPFLLNSPGDGPLHLLRNFLAHWLAIAAAAISTASALIALQGLTFHLSGYRLFLRISAWVQVAAFALIVGVYILKPPFPSADGLQMAVNGGWIRWLPSFWYFGLSQTLSANTLPEFTQLGSSAVIAFGVTLLAAAVTFGAAHWRAVRKVVEQPEPRGLRSLSRIGTALVNQFFAEPLDRAIVLFTLRTAARSRHHRLVLAALSGVAFSLALWYARDLVYGYSSIWDSFSLNSDASTHWQQANIPFLAGSLILLCFAIIAARGAFLLPASLGANWAFRITMIHRPGLYFAAVRKALLVLAVVPVLVSAGVLLVVLWPLKAAIAHLMVLTLAAALLVELALYQFRKIPFACSYSSSGKALPARLGAYALVFLLAADRGVQLEYWAMQDLTRFAVLAGVLCAAAIWAFRRKTAFDEALDNRVQFEDNGRSEVSPLDLRQDGAWTAENVDAESIDIRPAPRLGKVMAQRSQPDRSFFLLSSMNSPPPEYDAPAAGTRIPLRTLAEQFFLDLSYGWRSLVRTRSVSLAAIGLIAIGIGWNTIIYSAIHSVLTKPAPGIRAKHLVSLGLTVRDQSEDPFAGADSYLNYLDYASQAHALSSVAAYLGDRQALRSSTGATYEVKTQFVTPNYFDVLEVGPWQGRAFTEEDARGASGLVAIISYDAWQRYFEAASDIVGQAVTMNGSPATIVGVLPKGFQGTTLMPNLEICLPLSIRANRKGVRLDNRAERAVQMIGRLAPGVSLGRAQAEADSIAARLRSAYPELNEYGRMSLAPYSATAFGALQAGRTRTLMAILMIVGLLTLLIVCANVANLILARAVARQRDMAVRQSLGASALRVTRMLVAEGMTLSLVGLAVAWGLAEISCSLVTKLIPPLESGQRIGLDLTPDWRVGIYAILLAAGTGLVFSVAPALKLYRQDLVPFIKAGADGVIQGWSKLSNGLVIVQLALSVVLLAQAGMALRAVSLIDTTDLGFAKDHLLLARVNTVPAAGGTDQNLALLERLRHVISNSPGVVAASYGLNTPPRAWNGMRVERHDGADLKTDGNFVGPGYLRALGVTILAGRDFSEQDLAANNLPAVINRKLAEALWPGQSPLGRSLLVSEIGVPATVIGMVPNGAFSGLDENGVSSLRAEERHNFVFLFDKRNLSAPGSMTFHVRYSGQMDSAARGIRAAIQSTDNRVLVASTIQRMETAWANLSAPAYFLSRLLGLFAFGALILSTIGLYAVVSFHAAKRIREFGIRMALGAPRRHIICVVLKQGLILSACGAVAGAFLSDVFAGALNQFLANIPPAEPWIYAGVVVVLALVSLLACYVPAHRAARIDPNAALRQE